MATIASRAGGTPFGLEVVTVAELLRRNGRAASQATAQDDEPLTTAISVGTLLRREGRAPHAVDRTVQPRARDLDADGAETDVIARTGPDRRVLVRRGAIGAGALLAAGAVLGATVLTDAPGQEQLVSGSYPGQGTLDAASTGPEAPAATTLPAASSPAGPDAGTPAPATWMNVAFPAALGGGTGSRAATPAPASGGTAGRPAAPTGGTTAPATSGASAPSSPTRTPAPSSSAGKPKDDSVTGRLGGAVGDAGGGTPLAPVTDAAGGAVSGLGQAVGGALAPAATSAAQTGGPVGGLLGGLL